MLTSARDSPWPQEDVTSPAKPASPGSNLDQGLEALAIEGRQRWPLAQERAARKTRAAVPNPDAGKLVKAAQKASTAAQRVVWLQRAASAWAKPLEPVAACRQGCAHCCHIAVTISSVEAALIGRHTGIKPAQPANAVRLQSLPDLQGAQDAIRGLDRLGAPTPCPFLVNSACSVYDVRPMACRLLLNLDDDDLLCRPVPGQDVSVPYANSEQLKTLYLMAQVATPLADIRDFFPHPVPSGSSAGKALRATEPGP